MGNKIIINNILVDIRVMANDIFIYFEMKPRNFLFSSSVHICYPYLFLLLLPAILLHVMEIQKTAATWLHCLLCSGFWFFLTCLNLHIYPFSHKSESSSSERKYGFDGNPVMSPGPIKRSSVAVCQSNCYRRTDLFQPLDLCFTFCFNFHLYHVNRHKATSIFWGCFKKIKRIKFQFFFPQ